MINAKKCPFCGSEPITISTGNHFPEIYYRLICPKNCCMQSKLYDSVTKAITDWNARVADGETSDGYHTFNELYHHRAVLFSVIVAQHPELSWKSKHHHDGTMYDGMFIVGINTPQGQATYHYDLPYWDMFKCQEVEYAPEWEGHTAAQAIERIGRLEPVRIGCWGVAEEEHYRAMECLEKMQFFMGQRAGRELWMSKPKNVQDVDIEQYNHDIETVMHYIQHLENHISELTEKVEQLEAAQPKWVSVNDMLPEKDGKYIVCTAKGSVYCTRFKAYGKSGSFQTDINTHITHWMLLPEPPKEDA